MVVVQGDAIGLLGCVAGRRKTGRAGRRFAVMRILRRHKADGPIVDVGGLAGERKRIMAGIQAAVGVDVAIDVHRRAGTNSHVVVIKDGVAPEGERFLLKNPPDAGDDVASIGEAVRILGVNGWDNNIRGSEVIVAQVAVIRPGNRSRRGGAGGQDRPSGAERVDRVIGKAVSRDAESCQEWAWESRCRRRFSEIRRLWSGWCAKSRARRKRPSQ